jgi:hypothetical protein
MAIPFVAATCLVLHIGGAQAQHLNPSQSSRGTRAARVPFVIYVPNNPAPPTSPTELQSTSNRGVTTVEVVRSIEVNLDGPNKPNVRETSLGTGDLLFSDTDDEYKGKYISGQNILRNNKNIATSNDINDKYREHYGNSEPKSIFYKMLTIDGLDFNSRILLGNTLIRKSYNEIGDHKYSYFSDPKVSDNKYHATYINKDSSSAYNKSRINVKFPPKIFPFMNVSSQQNRRNKTSVINNQVSQPQKAFYRNRIGKKTQINLNNIHMHNTGNENSLNPSEQTRTDMPHIQSKKEKLQALTHWDFGKKTPNSSTDETYEPNSGQSLSPSVDEDVNDFVTELSQLMPHARSPLQPLERPTPESVTKDVIKASVGSQDVPQNTFSKHQRLPILNSINSIQTIPVFPTVNSIKSAQEYRDVHNGNIIRQQAQSNAFPNTHVQDYSDEIANGNIQETNKRIYSSEATARNCVPVINVGEQLEQQHGVRNYWRSVYFVPHVALQQQQQQQQVPTVFTLQPVATGGTTRTVPFVIREQYPRLFQAAVVSSNPAIPAPNGVVYEGKHHAPEVGEHPGATQIDLLSQ